MSASPSSRVTYRFGEQEFLIPDLDLRRLGTPVPIARKPAQLLAFLLRHPGRVVSREELLQALWPDVRVSDAAFHSVVRDLRRALGDQARDPRMVTTARGRGLRFTAPVEIVEHPVAPISPDGGYVGRPAVLAALRAALRAARSGSGRVVFLSGEAGIGKTRTALEIAQYARSEGVSVHISRCWRPGSSPPFRPWVELLQSVAKEVGIADANASFEPGAPLLTQLVAPSGAPDPTADAQQARFDAFDHVVRWLARAAHATPLMLVIDDLEDADPATVGLLEFVADRVADSRILLIGNYRGPGMVAGHPLLGPLARLARLAHVDSHVLRGLDRDETRGFIEAVAHKPHSDADVDALHARTDGNPFLLGLLARTSDAPCAGAPDATVPERVRDWIRGCLAELSPRCVECLEVAATIGRVFADERIRTVTSHSAAEVTAALDEARRAGLLAWDQPRFAHWLLHDAVYDEIPADRRAQLHGRIGEATLSLGDPELLASAAHHLGQAVQLVGLRAVDVAERAAEYAEKQLAFEDAVQLYDLGRAGLDALDSPDAARRCELLISRGRTLLAARRVPEAWETARQAASLARQTGRVDQLARAALILAQYVLADSAEPLAMLEEAWGKLPAEARELRARVACALSVMLWYHGQRNRRLALAQEARATAATLDDPSFLIQAFLAERMALCAPDRLPDRIRVTRDALQVADRCRNETYRCLVLSWRAVDLLELGDVLGAQLNVDEISRIAGSDGAPRMRSFPVRWRAMRELAAGRFAEASQHIRMSRDLMLRAGDPNAESYSGIQAGMILLEEGRGADVAKQLQAAPWLDAYRRNVPSFDIAMALVDLEAGSPGPARHLLRSIREEGWKRLDEDPELLGTSSWLAEICDRLGDAEFSAELYERLLPFADRVSCFYGIACRGALARYLGLLARTAGHRDADRHFEAAAALNRALDASLYRAWSLWEWSETIALRDGARPHLAQALAAEAKAMANDLGLGRLLDAMRASKAAPTIFGDAAG